MFCGEAALVEAHTNANRYIVRDADLAAGESQLNAHYRFRVMISEVKELTCRYALY